MRTVPELTVMTTDYVPPEGGEGKQSSNQLTLVEFHGALLVAVLGDSPATTMVAMKPVVEGMGLDWKNQYEKIKNHPVLATCMVISTMQMPGDQRREWVFLPLTRLNFWLATIQPNRIPSEETRGRVIEYQTECADALFDHFFGKATSSSSEPEGHAVPGPKPYYHRSIAERTCAREDIRLAIQLGGIPHGLKVANDVGFPTPAKGAAHSQPDLFEDGGQP